MQTYGTCRLLKEAGHEVTVINLIHPKIKNKYLHFKSWKYIFREFLFWRFKRKYFSAMSRKMYSINQSQLPEADITIVGSDQVWNSEITGIFGNTYFLDFVPKNQRRIALSSSFGVFDWSKSEENTQVVKMLLNKFYAISVREDSGVKIMKETFGLDSLHLLDPSLACGQYSEMLLSKNPQKQIFSFLLNNSVEAKNLLSRISQSLNIKVYNPSIFATVFHSGPRQWLTNIYSSEYVITDSFHGLALSIIFKKSFFVFCADKNKFARIKSLLELLGLEDRYVKSYEDFEMRKRNLVSPIDYVVVDRILEKERIKYRNFLKENLDL